MHLKAQSEHFDFKKIVMTWKTVLFNLFLIFAGITVFVIGMNSILIPNNLLGTGVSGVAILIHYLLPSADVGITYFILNIPLMVIGWFIISKRFMLYTIFGMAYFSLAAAVLKTPPVPLQDPILVAVFSGIICGTGSGIVLRSFGSAGGVDILAIYANKKFGLRPGLSSFFVNAVVILTGAYFFGLQIALYSMIYVFTSSKALDAVLTGFNQRLSTMIISDKYKEITEEIFRRVKRGATFLQAHGAYTGIPKEVIFTITTLTELPKLKNVIFSIDPKAFVVVNSTLEVIGTRHGTRKVY
ncbi:MAG: YitT family protein [Desulfobacterales bacterium]